MLTSQSSNRNYIQKDKGIKTEETYFIVRYKGHFKFVFHESTNMLNREVPYKFPYIAEMITKY